MRLSADRLRADSGHDIRWSRRGPGLELGLAKDRNANTIREHDLRVIGPKGALRQLHSARGTGSLAKTEPPPRAVSPVRCVPFRRQPNPAS